MFKKLPLELSILKEFQVLDLRGCRLLENVDEIHELTKLLILQISGAHFVEEIHDDLFEHMKDLRSLSLYEVGIKWLPASVLNQSELRWLILRNCPNLKQLCDFKLLKTKESAKQEVLSLAKLEVFDFFWFRLFHKYPGQEPLFSPENSNSHSIQNQAWALALLSQFGRAHSTPLK